MTFLTTVETQQTAKEIINNKFNEMNLSDGYFEITTCKCGCGEANCVLWSNQDTLMKVAVCDVCGDDDAFIDEVLYINNKRYNPYSQ